VVVIHYKNKNGGIMNKIFIDNTEVSENEYLQRVKIVEEESNICEEFVDLLNILETNSQYKSESIDDFVSRVSGAYLDFIDFYDTEYIEEYIC